MPENRKQEQNEEAATTEEVGADSGTAGGDAELDLEGLDLTVETVEERISPSETNVFDK